MEPCTLGHARGLASLALQATITAGLQRVSKRHSPAHAPTLTTSLGRTGCCTGCFLSPSPPKHKLQEHSTTRDNEAQIFAKPRELQNQTKCYLIIKLQFPTLMWKQLGAACTTWLAGSYGMELLQGERIRGASLGYNSSFVGKWLEGRLESQPLQPSCLGCTLARGKRAKNAMGCIRLVIMAGAGEQHAVKNHRFWKRLLPAAIWGSATSPPHSGPAPSVFPYIGICLHRPPRPHGTWHVRQGGCTVLGGMYSITSWDWDAFLGMQLCNGGVYSKSRPVTQRRRGLCSH